MNENPAAGRYPIAAIALGLMLTGALLPTPLFELYHRAWGLTAGDLSLVFAIYAGSLIPSLLLLGGLSDGIGRRRTMLVSFVLLAIASFVFAFAQNLWGLIAARVIQGLAMGVGTGAASAAIPEWMHEADRPRSATVTIVSISVGSIAGALLGGILGEYAPDPTRLPYFVHIGLLALGAIAVASVPACPHLRPAKLTSALSLPKEIRRPFAVAAVGSFVAWSSYAIFIAIVPAFLAQHLALHNLLVGASVITCIMLGSIVATIAGARLPVRGAIVAGLAGLGAGIWLLLVAVELRQEAVVVIASLICGAGGALVNTAGFKIIGRVAPAEHRAETVAEYLVACYLGYSVPALAVGIAAVHVGITAAYIAGAIVLGVIAVGMFAFTTERNIGTTPA